MVGPLLYQAAAAGSDELVALLLRHGVDPNLQGSGPQFNFPIVGAADAGHVQTVRLLLDAGADPDLFSQEYGVTALAAAVKEGREDAVRFLLEHGGKVTPAVLYVARTFGRRTAPSPGFSGSPDHMPHPQR